MSCSPPDAIMNTIASILALKYARIFVRGLSVPRSELFSESSSRKTVSFECPRTNIRAHFRNQMEAIVFIVLQLLLVTNAVCLGNILSGNPFRPITCGRKCFMNYKMSYNESVK